MQRCFFLEDPKDSDIRCPRDDTDNLVMSVEVCKEEVLRDWNFRVRASNFKPEEVVCVTGDIPELGNWVPEKCVVLDKIESDLWAINLRIPESKKIHYRYFIGVVVDLHKHVIVRCWETNFRSRKIRAAQIQETEEEPEIFGSYNGLTKVDKGWLIKGTIIQLMLCKQPFKLWREKYENRKLHIKVTPVNLMKHSHGPEKNDVADESLSNDGHNEQPKYSYTDVASLSLKDSRFKPQGQFGHKFREGDLIIFQCYMLNPETTALLIDIYVYSSKAIDDEPPYHAGFCYLLPSVFENSTGTITLPLTSTKQRPLGELKMEYLVIQPLKNFKSDMQKTYSRYWKKTKHGLDIGHRGSGSSFKLEKKDSAEIRENTIASFKNAITHGADYVEFDVQLSKDLVPVIYHDYHVCIAMNKKKTLVDTDMFELPIKDLTLNQLKMLKLYHVMEGKTNNPRFFDEDLEEHQPFPTLKSALEMLDLKCGFNIELKWTNKYMDGTYELRNAADINLFVDTILEVVLKYGEYEDREIVFSSFNADICTLIRFKQNKYPVMFLTQGETTKYQHYDDPRCWNIKSGVQFVNMSEMLGLCAHTEDILRDSSLVQYGLNAGLILFCWGDDISNPDTIKYLKDLCLHGIIYDKIYQYKSKKQDNIYLLEARDSQKDVIRMAAQFMELAVGEDTQLVKNAGELRKVKFPDDDDRLSTATSLASLESENEQALNTVQDMYELSGLLPLTIKLQAKLEPFLAVMFSKQILEYWEDLTVINV